MSPGLNEKVPFSYTILEKAPTTPDWTLSNSASTPSASLAFTSMVGGWPAEQYVARPWRRSSFAMNMVTKVSTREKLMSMRLSDRAIRAGLAPSQAYAVSAVLTSADIDAASTPFPDTSPKIITARSSGRRMRV